VCVPTLDARATDDAAFGAVLDRVTAAEGPVYIHCAYGFGRSAALVAAVLIRRGLARDVDEAVAMLAKARPGVRLYPRQRDVVRRATAAPAAPAAAP
jgi:protein-tyrosine phosphatase